MDTYKKIRTIFVNQKQGFPTKWFVVMTTFAVLIAASTAHSQELKKNPYSKSAQNQGTPYTYKTGKEVRTIYLHSEMATTIAGTPKVVTLNSSTQAQVKGGNLDNLSAQGLSPVFTTNGDPGSPKMSLPGGVLIILKPGVLPNQFATSRGIVISRVLANGKILSVDTEPGLASIHLCNSLANDPDIESIEPNFWVEHSTR